MAVCYVVGAGECDSLPIKKQDGDMIISADGGAKYLKKFGLTADIFIGDFDSLGLAGPFAFQASEIDTVRFFTASELADPQWRENFTPNLLLELEELKKCGFYPPA